MISLLNIKVWLFFLLFLVTSYSNYENENEYDISKIPLEFILTSKAVVRKDILKFEMEDQRNASMKVTYAVTIFDKTKQHLGELNLPYDDFNEIIELDGIIYDSKGEEIRDLEDSDIKDFSYYDGFSLYSDNRIKFIKLYYDKFPYTVEYTYEIRLNGYLQWPKWSSRNSDDPSNPIQETVFEVVTPTKYELRYWCNQDSIKPEVGDKNGKKIYRWFQNNLPFLSEELLDDDFDDISTIVQIAPTNFEIESYKGNMDTWENFGQWFNTLCEGKNILPENAVKEINEKLIGCKDKKEKVTQLYSYMQSRTRYVSIQLGIGGWQPFDATYVHNNGYGDCKALSNYMVSILKSAGITAYYVLIKSGHYKRPFIKEFPSNQFNHVIVCVPLEQDSMWLECTSQVMPAGSIGWSNENREALMITPEGGTIVRTPASSAEKNIQVKTIDVNLAENGTAQVKSGIKWLGNQHDYVIHSAYKSQPEDQVKWIKNLLDAPDIKLKSFLFQHENKSNDSINLEVDLTLQRYGAVSGKRLFFNPNLMEKNKTIPKDNPNRTSPVRLKYPYLDIDSIKYVFPTKYKVEAIPKEININASFGTFSCYLTENEDNSISYIRKLEMNDYIIPPENYSEYQKFFVEVVKADKQQVVLVKTD